ncbi:transglycosylase domain-containing protein [Actinoplanes sp. N902-109]|uniref:transglycosylase domain-containing protein n=1 Tax=Actinoplanes sp. (strain N902-109) TaxID=649831 RepID=UPI00032946A7|nr:transglycosylase domain-containing protein [Actinoplanes sp. N902-109]AGL14848.1 peptidoglycan glycosyltransferase [Actinoplanes sp. N902-109]
MIENGEEYPAPQATKPRRRLWRRIVVRLFVIVLFYGATGAAAAEAYVESVPLPATPIEPQASTLYFRDGSTILARVGTVDHSDVPLSAVPEAVRSAVLAAEDREFYQHGGVSMRGVMRAVVADVSGSRQGASTITQQYARNAFLTQDVSVGRKAKEMALSVQLERKYTKNQILERYLNTIYYGRGAQGIAAAAHAYFGITPEKLTPAQGAVLAAVVKDPWGYDPANDAEAARARWNWVVKSEKDLGWLRGDLTYPAVAPATAKNPGADGIIIDRVERELARHGVNSQTLHTGGLKVVTTLDAAAQKAVVRSVGAELKKLPKDTRAALVALDPKTGGVRAYYGGAERGYFDDASASHPAASTFKPIVLAAALRKGISALSKWDGSSPRIFPGRLGVPLKNHKDQQCPFCTLEASMVDSLNTPFYAVTEQIGVPAVRDMAWDLGISKKYGSTPTLVDVKGDPKPGKTRADIAIGRYAVTPGDLATVYATFASGGVRHDRYFVQTTDDGAGKRVYTALPTSTPVLDTAVAADVTSVLSKVVKHDKVTPGRPAAGKTGSQQWGNSSDTQDAWMAGYTPDLASAVWLGKAKPGPLRDKNGKPIEGDGVPARLWRDFTRAALTGSPQQALPKAAHVGRTDVGDAGKVHDTGTGTGNQRGESSSEGQADGDGKLGFGTPVVHTAGSGKRLALTFDDGPSPYTPQILAILKQYGIKATFCMVGEEATNYPSYVRQVVADGHQLCNHSWEHDDLGQLTAADARADIMRTDAAIAAAAPGATIAYFRAPYGSFGKSGKEGAKLGHTPLGWVVDPDDWLLPGADVIAQRIEDQLTPRAVVLVHDGGGDRSQTVDAIRKLIPKLLHDGWTFDLPERTVKSHPQPQPTPSRQPHPEEHATTPPTDTPAPSHTPSPEVSSSSPAPDPTLTSPSEGVEQPEHTGPEDDHEDDREKTEQDG